MSTSEFQPARQVTNCPYCNAPNNAWSSSDGVIVDPEVGSVSLCFHCGGLAIYFDKLTTRRVTAEEEQELSELPTVSIARRAISYTDSPRLARALIGIMQP